MVGKQPREGQGPPVKTSRGVPEKQKRGTLCKNKKYRRSGKRELKYRGSLYLKNSVSVKKALDAIKTEGRPEGDRKGGLNLKRDTKKFRKGRLEKKRQKYHGER